MDFVKSYFGKNEPLTNWTLLSHVFSRSAFLLKHFLKNPYFNFLDSDFFWNFATFHSFLTIKQTISFIIFELNLPKLAKIMGCKLVRLSQPILLDLCLHPSINAFLQDGCRYLLSIFKCSIAQKHSKILFFTVFFWVFFLPCREQDLLTFNLWRSSFEQ